MEEKTKESYPERPIELNILEDFNLVRGQIYTNPADNNSVYLFTGYIVVFPSHSFYIPDFTLQMLGGSCMHYTNLNLVVDPTVSQLKSLSRALREEQRKVTCIIDDYRKVYEDNALSLIFSNND